MATKKSKNTDKEKDYLQSMKSVEAAMRSRKTSSSPSASTRERTGIVRYRKAQKKMHPTSLVGTLGSLATLGYFDKPSGQGKVDKAMGAYIKKESKDMNRRRITQRNLKEAKKNVNKKIK